MCGLVYTPGCEEDEALHDRMHSAASEIVHRGWKQERIVKNCGSEKVATNIRIELCTRQGIHQSCL